MRKKGLTKLFAVFFVVILTVGLVPHTAIAAETYAVSFESGDGTGEMASVEVPAGSIYTFPDCTFTPPEHKAFDSWSFTMGDRTGNWKDVGFELKVEDDVVLTPIYELATTPNKIRVLFAEGQDQYVESVKITVEDYQGTGEKRITNGTEADVPNGWYTYIEIKAKQCWRPVYDSQGPNFIGIVWKDSVLTLDCGLSDNEQGVNTGWTVEITESKPDHMLTKTDEVGATCTEDGTKAYWTCEHCNKMFSDEKAENEIRKPETIEATGHKWGDWETVTPATADAPGEEARTCDNCGEKETNEIPQLIVYANTEGDGSTWNKGNSRELTFRFERSFDDDLAFENFIGVAVDGESLEETDYTAKPGSVIITLAPEYLDKLSPGKHTISASFNDGDDATAEFTIEKKKEEAVPPKTGDESHVLVWAAVTLVTALSAAYVMLKLRRQES